MLLSFHILIQKHIYSNICLEIKIESSLKGNCNHIDLCYNHKLRKKYVLGSYIGRNENQVLDGRNKHIYIPLVNNSYYKFVS